MNGKLLTSFLGLTEYYLVVNHGCSAPNGNFFLFTPTFCRDELPPVALKRVVPALNNEVVGLT